MSTGGSGSGGGFEDMLKSLQKDYLASLPQKIAVIRAQIADVGAGSTTTAALRESFHKLKGTGTTYGLPEVSELAEVVEDICSTSPVEAVNAATQAAGILEDIFAAHSRSLAFNLHLDPRFQAIRKK